MLSVLKLLKESLKESLKRPLRERPLRESQKRPLREKFQEEENNFLLLMNLIENATISPMVNQVETHVELQNEFLRDYCEKNGIVLEAYAPLMSWKVKELLENEILISIAAKYNKTVPQIAINWLNSRGIVALPKSINEHRIIANFDVFDFELSTEDLEQIKSLNKGNKL